MRALTAYLRAEQLVIHTSSSTEAGFWVACNPVIVTTIDEAPEVIGHIARYMLPYSRTNIRTPHPNEMNATSVLKAAGVKTWASLSKNALCVSIEENGAQITFVPARNVSARLGFEELPEKAFSLFSPSAQALGKALLDAFDLAE